MKHITITERHHPSRPTNPTDFTPAKPHGFLVTVASRLPAGMTQSPLVTEEQTLRFLSRLHHVNEDGCIMWGGRRNSDGGKLSFNGKEIAAHRLAYMMHHGAIPPGMHVRHTCNHALCMTKEHLYLAAPATSLKKPIPVKAYRKKLSPEDIQAARYLRSEGRTLSDIANLYDVSPATIYNACIGITYKHIPPAPGMEPKQLP